MENHVHLIAIPHSKKSLARGIAETHRKYTTIINIREDWGGYLWQGRFASYPLDDRHLYSAVRYVEKNPVRAKLVERAEDYPWSSARAHIHKKGDPLLSEIDKFLKIEDWSTYLKEDEEASDIDRIEMHARTGRPLGDDQFIDKLEKITGRPLRPRVYTHKRGTEYCVPLFK
jgi:putative transposase